MWIYAIIAVIGLGIVTGGYFYISGKDNTIKALTADNVQLKGALASKEQQVNRMTLDIKESVEQANRLKAKDVEERNRLIGVEITLREPEKLSIDAINAYQACVTSNPGDTECIKLLQQ